VRTDGGAITVTFDVVVMKVVISIRIWLSTVNIVDPLIDVWMTTGFTKDGIGKELAYLVTDEDYWSRDY